MRSPALSAPPRVTPPQLKLSFGRPLEAQIQHSFIGKTEPKAEDKKPRQDIRKQAGILAPGGRYLDGSL